MELLFLDTYYVDGTKEIGSLYQIARDILIPLLAGLFIPGLIFLFTVWKDYYDILLSRYHFREGIFFKNLAIMKDNENDVALLQKHIDSLSLNNPIIVREEISFKNIEDILNLPFEKVIEAFHDSLNNEKNFLTEFNEYNKSIISLSHCISHYDTLCTQVNEENFSKSNECAIFHRELRAICNEFISRLCDCPEEDGCSLWRKIEEKLDEIHSLQDVYSIRAKLSELKRFIEFKYAPDLPPNSPISVIVNLLDNYSIMDRNIEDFKEQCKGMIDLKNTSNHFIRKIHPKIRIQRPNKMRFWRYFCDK